MQRVTEWSFALLDVSRETLHPPVCAIRQDRLANVQPGGVSGCPGRVRTYQELTDHDRDPSDDLGR